MLEQVSKDIFAMYIQIFNQYYRHSKRWFKRIDILIDANYKTFFLK